MVKLSDLDRAYVAAYHDDVVRATRGLVVLGPTRLSVLRTRARLRERWLLRLLGWCGAAAVLALVCLVW